MISGELVPDADLQFGDGASATQPLFVPVRAVEVLRSQLVRRSAARAAARDAARAATTTTTAQPKI